MSWKKDGVTWLIIFALVTTLGYVIHGVMLSNDYLQAGDLFRSEEEAGAYLPYLLVGNIFFAFAFVAMYARGVEDKPWWPQGVRYGVWVALLVVIPFFLIGYATQPVPGSLVTKQIIYEFADMVVLGVATAALYRR